METADERLLDGKNILRVCLLHIGKEMMKKTLTEGLEVVEKKDELSWNERESTFKSIKWEKSPGPDKVSVEMIRAAGHTVMQ